MKKYILSLLGVALLSSSIQAKEKIYVGAALNIDTVETKTYDQDKMGGITLKAGYDFTEYMGVELRYSQSLFAETLLSLDSSVGLYAKPQYTVDEERKVYALLGYAQTEATASDTNKHSNQSEFSYGLGFEYKVNKEYAIAIEALSLINKDTSSCALKANQLNIGVVYTFGAKQK